MKRLDLYLLRAIAIFAGLWLICDFSARFFAEILWFQEVDYLSVFLVPTY